MVEKEKANNFWTFGLWTTRTKFASSKKKKKRRHSRQTKSNSCFAPKNVKLVCLLFSERKMKVSVLGKGFSVELFFVTNEAEKKKKRTKRAPFFWSAKKTKTCFEGKKAGLFNPVLFIIRKKTNLLFEKKKTEETVCVRLMLN
jgi:hypothetical protein